MRLYTTFDDNFLPLARAFFNSLRAQSDVPAVACLASHSTKSIAYCKEQKITYLISEFKNMGPKPVSRLLKMGCLDEHGTRALPCHGTGALPYDGPAAYMDIDIIFQNDIESLAELNPNYIWVLSKREGHQTTLRKWKKHYFAKNDVEYVRKTVPLLDDQIDVEKVLESPVRNCGVLYSNGSQLQALLQKARGYYKKLLAQNKKKRHFSESDQLCFVLAFTYFEDKIKELPLRFNRMPYHQSYDFKDKSCFLVPDNVVLHLNRCKGLGSELTSPWSNGKVPIIIADSNTRSGIVVPMQTSSVAERALMKNLYTLAVVNRANVYRDEEVGFPIARKIEQLDKIRDKMKGERPAFDKGLFFMVNNFLFMIDHGEHVNNRGAWIIGKYVKPQQLAGIFMEQMEKRADYKKSNIPILPLAYGTKQPSLWLNQHVYHDLGLNGPKKHSVHFIGCFSTNNKQRNAFAKQLSKIPNAKIENRSASKRVDFDEYMRDMAASQIVWCPPGGRPKTHREIEAYCCEIAVMMPKQNIIEQEVVKPDVHYICIKDDYSDASQQVEKYLNDPDALKNIARNGRLWYERNASDVSRAKYIHEKCLKIIARLTK